MEKAFQLKEPTIPADLCYLYGSFMEDYLHDVEICQRFARRSREKMAEIILQRTGMEAKSAFHTIHNYINVDERILRKGAIAAHEGELVLTLSMDEYRRQMAGVYTTSVNEHTIDEAPMAYKSLEDIIDVIRDSVDVIEVLKPIYNFKASD